MADSNGSSGKQSLRTRVRAAGGWYSWINASLIKAAGPASVGPYETSPEPARTARPCPLCGAPMNAHTFDRTGTKPLMHCP
nr:hypothetical protein [Microbacterium endophyticum]